MDLKYILYTWICFWGRLKLTVSHGTRKLKYMVEQKNFPKDVSEQELPAMAAKNGSFAITEKKNETSHSSKEESTLDVKDVSNGTSSDITSLEQLFVLEFMLYASTSSKMVFRIPFRSIHNGKFSGMI